ncbi:MAG: iron-containing alcohol dehydrogenase [Candidatus Bathyarchaeota archaeon]|nr:MAG: iron-containing alcohol dehydrogenase [Candidatus Bathyarchaeota archaeon]
MSEDIFKLEMPKKTYFSVGAVKKVGEAVKEFNASTVFIVTDRGVVNAGLVAPLKTELSSTATKISVFDETEPEPTVESIEKAVKALEKVGGADLLVALGGGSVMDTAKCVNIVAMNGESILDYEDSIENPRPIRKLLPFIAIPTTAGTGSEASIWAVFTDTKRKLKTSACDPRLIADVAILDPNMTRTLPPTLTAATGMDALTHAIEAYVCMYANPVTDAFSIQAIKLIAESLRTAVKDGENMEARTNMILASFMAGSAFSNSSLGIVHSMSEAFGGFYRIPHGIANALVLPHGMEFNLSTNVEKFAKIAEFMGEDVKNCDMDKASEKSVSAVKELSKAIRLPQTLREMGVKKEDFPALVEIAYKWADDSGNPREVSEEQLRELYEKAY